MFLGPKWKIGENDSDGENCTDDLSFAKQNFELVNTLGTDVGEFYEKLVKYW